VLEESEDKHSDHKFCKQIPKLPALPACQYAPLFEEKRVKVVGADCQIIETSVENDGVDLFVLLNDLDSSVLFKDEIALFI
jgi:alkyl hydroperoxide reductase subunit AhpF